MNKTDRLEMQGAAAQDAVQVPLLASLGSDRVYRAQGLGVYHALEAVGPCEAHDHAEAQIMITFPRAVYHAVWETDLGARRRQRFTGVGVNIIPAGQTHGFDWQQEDRLLSLYLHPLFMTRLAEELGGIRTRTQEIRAQWGAANPLLQQIGQDLWREFRHDAAPSPLYVESALTMVAGHLLRPSASPTGGDAAAGGLSPRKLRQTLDYIRDCCHTDLSLQEMAHAVHLDRHHFARAFKQSVGVPPYEYVLRCRIERACALLTADTRRSVASVALAVGFHDAGQFARHFKRIVGVTPRAHRERKAS